MNTIQQQFLRKIEDLSNLLRYPQPTTGLIIKATWAATITGPAASPLKTLKTSPTAFLLAGDGQPGSRRPSR